VTAGRFDPAERKRAKRTGRQRGCWIYIAGELLEASGIDLKAPPPWYRVWAGRRGRFIVTLYQEK
jgi:hypothetical protein